MRGWPSVLVGAGVLATAIWLLLAVGPTATALACLMAGGFIFYQAYRNVRGAGGADPMALVDFVTDPAGALVDAAIDRADEWLDDKPERKPEEKPRFDADAAFERYMAGRPAPSAVEPAPAARGFGRKGLPSRS